MTSRNKNVTMRRLKPQETIGQKASSIDPPQEADTIVGCRSCGNVRPIFQRLELSGLGSLLTTRELIGDDGTYNGDYGGLCYGRNGAICNLRILFEAQVELQSEGTLPPPLPDLAFFRWIHPGSYLPLYLRRVLPRCLLE